MAHPQDAELTSAFGSNKFENQYYKEGFIKHTVRFDPYLSKSSGMFIAKIAKPAQSK